LTQLLHDYHPDDGDAILKAHVVGGTAKLKSLLLINGYHDNFDGITEFQSHYG
jgi:hypothetical protein